jgi:hypothetical protein
MVCLAMKITRNLTNELIVICYLPDPQLAQTTKGMLFEKSGLYRLIRDRFKAWGSEYQWQPGQW